MRVDVYNDFDEFATSLDNVEVGMTFRHAKHRIWRHTAVDVGRLALQRGDLGSGNIARGQMATGGYILYVPLTPATEYVANGTPMPEDSFAIMEPGCEFCYSTKTEHDWAGLFVPVDALRTAGECPEPPLELGDAALRVTPALPQAARRFRTVLRDVLNAAATCPQFETSPAARCAESDLFAIASLVLGRQPASRPHLAGHRKLPRKEIIQRCHELLEQRAGWRPVQVGELVEAAGVSERTLRTAFQEYFGVAPLRYLQLRQLDEVRRALRAAEPESRSVSSILVEHGVFEFGRFASRYRQRHGELPSATLRA